MSIRTGLLSFSIANLAEQELVKNVQECIKAIYGGVNLISQNSLTDGIIAILAPDNSTLTITVRIYRSKKLVTVNLEDDANGQIINNANLDKFQEKLSIQLNNIPVDRIPVLKRNMSVPNYYTSSDDRILEYDFDKVVIDVKSNYQQVKILHSPTLGNCLLLDDLQNLAEADLSYTQGLMDYGKETYAGKEILILGGGDGGLLHELLKENPKFVTMVDIDQVVLDSCKQYLRGACGSDLDNLEGPNYHVIVGDCIKYMEKFIEQKRSFDVVFNDLTDIPISIEDSKAGDAIKANNEEMWLFVKRILTLALQLVRPDGQYLNHVCRLKSICWFV